MLRQDRLRAAAARAARGEIAPPWRCSPPDQAQASPRELYRQLFSVAYTFELDEDESQLYLTDVDDTFYSADYARAFVLAGMMHESIRRRFGEDWYGNKQVGNFLARAALRARDLAVLGGRRRAAGFRPQRGLRGGALRGRSG